MAAFQLRFMALAVDVIDRRGPSNEIHRHLQPKKTKMKRFSFKSECVMQVENGKMCHQL